MNPQKFDAFVEEVLALETSERIAKQRKIEDKTTIAEEKTWLSWAQGVENEGEDVLLAQVNAKTILTRQHTRLPVNSGIAWPRCLQVRYITETERAEKSTAETTTGETATEDDARISNEFDQRWLSKEFSGSILESSVAASSLSSAASTSASAAADKDAEEKVSKMNKNVVQNVRKAHNAWDKDKRHFTATIERSKTNANTRNCRFESELATMIARGDSLDATLVALEAKHIQGLDYNDADISSATMTCAELKVPNINIHINKTKQTKTKTKQKRKQKQKQNKN